MRPFFFSLLLCFCASRACITGRAEEAVTNLPGARLTTDKAIRFSWVDLVAEAELVALGELDPPRMPGVLTYEKAELHIVKVFKGQTRGIIHKLLYLAMTPSERPERVQEKTRYLIICAAVPDGRSCILKMLPDDKKDKKEVAAAITRLANAPPVLLWRGKFQIQEEEELEDVLARKDVGLIAVAELVKVYNEILHAVGQFDGDFKIERVLKGEETAILGKTIHLVGPMADLHGGARNERRIPIDLL